MTICLAAKGRCDARPAGPGGLDVPSTGTVEVAGRNVSRMTEGERTMFRRNRVAFIFQSFGLIPMLSAAENVGIPHDPQLIDLADSVLKLEDGCLIK
jgi:predicted ABC-type transport system involved in lysophospholipase L1 biosynthesis ATPase subunit